MVVKRRLTRLKGQRELSPEVREAAMLLKQTFLFERQRHEMMRTNQDIPSYAELAVWHDNMDPAKKVKNKRDANYKYRSHPELRKSNPETSTKHMFWFNMARSVLAKRVDPRLFIRAQFYMLNPLREAPTMFNFRNARMFENVDDAQKEFKSLYHSAHRSYVSLYHRQVLSYRDMYDTDSVEASLATLLDDSLEMDAITRYCLATHLRGEDRSFKDVMLRYRVSACLEYVRFPQIYQEVCVPRFLTKGLKQNAERVYEAVFRGTLDV